MSRREVAAAGVLGAGSTTTRVSPPSRPQEDDHMPNHRAEEMAT